MNRLAARLLRCALVTLLIILLPRVVRIQAATARGACGAWSVVPSPNQGANDNSLGAVSVAAANDVWAVGSYLLAGQSGITQALIDHWDGKRWSVAPAANLGSLSNALYGVAAIAHNDAWAVGSRIGGDFLPHALIEHWDGTLWRIVPAPDSGAAGTLLYGVSGVAAGDVWAVGYARAGGTDGAFRTLIEHWDGTRWSVIPSPDPGTTSNLLYGVTAVSSSNVWAVGQYLNGSGPDQALIEHWDGRSWSAVVSPTDATASNVLYGVSAASARSVWSVGDLESDATPMRTLGEQWNGARWSAVPTPGVGASDNILYGVAAITASNVWAVGDETASSGNYQTLIEHWNGTQWSVASSPSPGSGNNILGGVAATPAGDLWAVGGDDSGGATRSLIEHYC